MKEKLLIVADMALIVVLATGGSCAWFKGAVHTAADAARVLCELWAQDNESQLKLSPSDFCAVAENIQPFIDAALAAKRDAGGTVGARVGITHGQP